MDVEQLLVRTSEDVEGRPGKSPTELTDVPETLEESEEPEDKTGVEESEEENGQGKGERGGGNEVPSSPVEEP